MDNQANVSVRRLARFYCAPDWSWDVAGRSDWTGEKAGAVPFNYDLWTVLEGAGTLTAEAGQEYKLGPGACFILRGDESYRARHEPSDPLVVFAVHFDFLDGHGSVEYPGTRLFRQIRNLDFLAHLFDRMETAWREQGGDADFWLSACLKEIDHQDREAVEYGYRRRQADLIRTLCREIMREPGREYRVGDLAARLKCSRFHFSRLFKDVTGKSPADFVVEARIEAARGLLHSSGYPISRIAELLGYHDVGFFSRQFRDRTGVSPSGYRAGQPSSVTRIRLNTRCAP